MAFNTVPVNGWPQLKNLGEGGGDVSALAARVEALETTVGDSDSGLVKDVDTLETTVGDSEGGLVKDVDTLETTVGDSEGGLVKDVADLQNANKYLTTETLVGKWGSANLYRKVVNIQALPNNSTEDITLGISGYTLRRLEAYYGNASEAGIMLMYLLDMYYTASTDKLLIHTNTDMSDYSGTIVVEYTK